jgi:signal transduction histidine kinase
MEHFEKEKKQENDLGNSIAVTDIIITNDNQTDINLFSIIAHDLRGPMASIVNMVELLLLKNDDFEILTYLKNTSKIALARLDELIQWGFSNKMNYNPQKQGISKLVDKVVDFCSIMSKEKSISLINCIEEQDFFIDEKMFSVVLENLIMNSIKFSSNNSEIFILSSFVNDNCLKIYVKDSGKGISIEDSEKIFDIQKTLNLSKSMRGYDASTGLGLVLCKNFVTKWGGEISVESEEGFGSTFKFTIPQPITKSI